MIHIGPPDLRNTHNTYVSSISTTWINTSYHDFHQIAHVSSQGDPNSRNTQHLEFHSISSLVQGGGCKLTALHCENHGLGTKALEETRSACSVDGLPDCAIKGCTLVTTSSCTT